MVHALKCSVPQYISCRMSMTPCIHLPPILSKLIHFSDNMLNTHTHTHTNTDIHTKIIIEDTEFLPEDNRIERFSLVTWPLPTCSNPPSWGPSRTTTSPSQISDSASNVLVWPLMGFATWFWTLFLVPASWIIGYFHAYRESTHLLRRKLLAYPSNTRLYIGSTFA